MAMACRGMINARHHHQRPRSMSSLCTLASPPPLLPSPVPPRGIGRRRFARTGAFSGSGMRFTAFDANFKRCISLPLPFPPPPPSPPPLSLSIYLSFFFPFLSSSLSFSLFFLSSLYLSVFRLSLYKNHSAIF